MIMLPENREVTPVTMDQEPLAEFTTDVPVLQTDTLGEAAAASLCPAGELRFQLKENRATHSISPALLNFIC